MSECLKLHIAQVFKDEVAKEGFSHVSIAKVMKKTGIRRQTFYYVEGEKTWHFNAELNRPLFLL